MSQSFYESVLVQIAATSERMSHYSGIPKLLRQPERELTVSIPIEKDTREIKVYIVYRVQHN